MIVAVNQYTYRAEWSPDSGEYVGSCIEFPSRYSRAPTAHEAIDEGRRGDGGLRRHAAGTADRPAL